MKEIKFEKGGEPPTRQTMECMNPKCKAVMGFLVSSGGDILGKRMENCSLLTENMGKEFLRCNTCLQRHYQKPEE